LVKLVVWPADLRDLCDVNFPLLLVQCCDKASSSYTSP
jgi:hypothetical protein